MKTEKMLEYSFPKEEKMDSLKEIKTKGSNIRGYYFKEETKIYLVDLIENVENTFVMYFYK